MADGSALDLTPAQLALIRAILARHVPDRPVWAFGSRVTGKARPFSDLDLAVIGDIPMPPDISAALREAFNESDLPFKVDVADWATTSAGFRAIIEAGKVVVREGG